MRRVISTGARGPDLRRRLGLVRHAGLLCIVSSSYHRIVSERPDPTAASPPPRTHTPCRYVSSCRPLIASCLNDPTLRRRRRRLVHTRHAGRRAHRRDEGAHRLRGARRHPEHDVCDGPRQVRRRVPRRLPIGRMLPGHSLPAHTAGCPPSLPGPSVAASRDDDGGGDPSCVMARVSSCVP